LHLSTRDVGLCTALALVLLSAPALASVESELAFHRGVIAYGEDRLDEAGRQFEIALAEDPEDTVAIHYLALIAQQQGDSARALELYDRALAIDPEDPDIQLDRGVALLDAGSLPEAREAFAKVLELEPDRARAHLFAGIAAYRAGAYAEALPHLNRAAELDPSIRAQSRYYTGLSDAFMGDIAGAEAAFADAETQSPLSPMGQSAQNLRQQLKPAPEDRRWQAALTAGFEYDSNPLILPDSGIVSADDDVRGVFRARGQYRLIQREKGSLTAGYDGYLSLHADQTEVDLQTHSAWISGGYNLGLFRLGLRYDYAFTFIDLSDPFRHLHRVTPSVSMREGEWGLSYLFYQFEYKDYLTDFATAAAADAFDLDGTRNLVGLSQFFFLPAPFTYVRVGLLGDFNSTDGTEWSYDGIDASLGSGYNFPYEVSLTWLYRFVYRDYDNASGVTEPPFTTVRDDKRHVFTAEIAKAITQHWEVSIGTALTWSNSNVELYDYDRQIGGAYVTYRF
jgi:tetratricopeptide (TPR) repeat protein